MIERRGESGVHKIRLHAAAMTTFASRKIPEGTLLARIRSRFAGRVLAVASATALQTVLAIILILLATRILSAGDFGLYGMVLSFVAMAAAISDGGPGLLLPARQSQSSPTERTRLFASFAFFSTATGVILGALLIGLFPWYSRIVPGIVVDDVPVASIWVVAALIPVRALAQLTGVYFSVSGRGTAIAAQLSAQSVASFTITLIALFFFDLGVASLFLGTLLGQITAVVVGYWALGRDYLVARPSRAWLAIIVRTAPTATASSLAESVRSVVENTILGSMRGLAAVGIFAHARQYHNLTLAIGNSIAHNGWAVSLSEARDLNSQFVATRRIWAPVYLTLVLFGFVFVFVGQEMVEFLTNGKLTPAWVYVPILVVITLIQNSGKAATAIVFASGRGATAIRMRTAFLLIGLPILYPAVSVAGIGGVIALLLIEHLAFRLVLRYLAMHQRSFPFQDGGVVAGAVALIGLTTFVHFTQPSFFARLICLFVSTVIVLGIGRRTVADVFTAGRNLVQLGLV